ncbi:MAG: hypothetical protein LUH50_06750 [Bacteroides intestinalis]|nr:hypothetical protein [Bacteroides intestinalis]
MKSTIISGKKFYYKSFEIKFIEIGMILQIVFLEKSEFCHKMKYDELFIPYHMGVVSTIMLFMSIYRLICMQRNNQKMFRKVADLQQENELLISSQNELKYIIWKTTPIVQYILALLEQGENKFLRLVHPLSKEESEALIVACNNRFEGKVNQLLTDYPQLSSDDLLLCCFIRMRIPISCISLLMSKEMDTIYKKKLRVKKKVHFDKVGLTLDEFLFQIW